MRAMKTALVMHEACARHDTGWAHPEHQGRLPAILNALYRDTPMLIDHVLQVEAEMADESDVLRAHSPEHLERLRRASREALETGRIVELDSETLMSPASWDAAFGAAGAAITATRLVLDGEAANAFALCRPPGHHATEDIAMGFCLINNVAVATRWARAQGIDRILIIDWDVHHGNGTQDIFYTDPNVYYLSLHQYPLYPNTGFVEERGLGAGIGTTRNVHVAAGTEGPDYLALFQDALSQTLAEFSPDLVFISAGFDCLRGDPLGGLRLEPEHLHAATRMIMGAAAESAQGRVVALLEGGYAPERVGHGVVDVMRAFSGLPPT